uniref:Uncharacterized protein n=1 Tax=Anopheles merus TaxID=30066 RepID=A0A182VF88_ANOME
MLLLLLLVTSIGQCHSIARPENVGYVFRVPLAGDIATVRVAVRTTVRLSLLLLLLLLWVLGAGAAVGSRFLFRTPPPIVAYGKRSSNSSYPWGGTVSDHLLPGSAIDSCDRDRKWRWADGASSTIASLTMSTVARMRSVDAPPHWLMLLNFSSSVSEIVSSAIGSSNWQLSLRMLDSHLVDAALDQGLGRRGRRLLTAVAAQLAVVLLQQVGAAAAAANVGHVLEGGGTAQPARRLVPYVGLPPDCVVERSVPPVWPVSVPSDGEETGRRKSPSSGSWSGSSAPGTIRRKGFSFSLFWFCWLVISTVRLSADVPPLPGSTVDLERFSRNRCRSLASRLSFSIDFFRLRTRSPVVLNGLSIFSMCFASNAAGSGDGWPSMTSSPTVRFRRPSSSASSPPAPPPPTLPAGCSIGMFSSLARVLIEMNELRSFM